MGLLSLAKPDAARYAPGTYHTHGHRLLRIEAGPSHELRQVEDRRTLDVAMIPMLELQALGLRPIGSGSNTEDGTDRP
jgi:hypothetical protein